jgi:hypothetical protein
MRSCSTLPDRLRPGFRRPILEGDILSLDMTSFSHGATKVGKFVT